MIKDLEIFEVSIYSDSNDWILDGDDLVIIED